MELVENQNPKEKKKNVEAMTPAIPAEQCNLDSKDVLAKVETETLVEVPIISEGEDSMISIPIAKVGSKKRRSLGGMVDDGEEHFRLKRRKIKVAGAPKMPLTGYVRYMNERRESLRKELPSKTAIEHTKIIGEEWNQLTEERKTPFMKAAEVDKQRYLSELHTFLKARPDVLACELAKNKAATVRKSNGGTGGATTGDAGGKIDLKEKTQANGNPKISEKATGSVKEQKRSLPEKDVSPPPSASLQQAQPKCKRTPTPISGNNINSSNNNNNSSGTMIPSAATLTTPVPGEIPIFTNEFLEHNKHFDMELRTLRKSKADLEQQNAVLEKHVENMKFGVEKMATENDALQEKNRLLEIYLDKLKLKLVHALAGLAIPSEPNGATVDNIDKYMNDLYKMATSNSHGPASLNKAKDIIRKLDLQIQL